MNLYKEFNCFQNIPIELTWKQPNKEYIWKQSNKDYIYKRTIIPLIKLLIAYKIYKLVEFRRFNWKITLVISLTYCISN